MPAGKYYVGDLCYVMTEEEWDEACELFFAKKGKSSCAEGKFILSDGRAFVCFNTFYGDGQYTSGRSYSFDVDSGSIGCIEVGDVSEKLPNSAVVVEFAEAFVCKAENGVMWFGDLIEINTRFDSEVEENEEGLAEEE
jgi:hypothetical protein